MRPCEPAVLEGAPRPEQELLLPQDEVRLPHPVPAHLAVGGAEELRQPAALRLERLKDQERLLGVGVGLEAEAAEVEPLLPHPKVALEHELVAQVAADVDELPPLVRPPQQPRPLAGDEGRPVRRVDDAGARPHVRAGRLDPHRRRLPHLVPPRRRERRRRRRDVAAAHVVVVVVARLGVASAGLLGRRLGGGGGGDAHLGHPLDRRAHHLLQRVRLLLLRRRRRRLRRLLEPLGVRARRVHPRLRRAHHLGARLLRRRDAALLELPEVFLRRDREALRDERARVPRSRARRRVRRPLRARVAQLRLQPEHVVAQPRRLGVRGVELLAHPLLRRLRLPHHLLRRRQRRRQLAQRRARLAQLRLRLLVPPPLVDELRLRGLEPRRERERGGRDGGRAGLRGRAQLHICAQREWRLRAAQAVFLRRSEDRERSRFGSESVCARRRRALLRNF